MATLFVDYKKYPTSSIHYHSIQSAIDAAKPFDSILVASGVYYEELHIRKPLTLLGANENQIPNNRSNPESIIDSKYGITISSNNVTINGFEIRNFKYGISIPYSSFKVPERQLRNITLSYNHIHSLKASMGVSIKASTLLYLTISYNSFYIDGDEPYAKATICFSNYQKEVAHYEHITIEHNYITNASELYGIYGDASLNHYLINHMKINYNSFQTSKTGSNLYIGNILNGEFSHNVIEHTGCTIGIRDGSISENTFQNGGHLSLLGTEFGHLRYSSNLQITDNHFSCEELGNALKLRPGVDSKSILLKNNEFLVLS